MDRKRYYDLDEDFSLDDPGNVLRERLSDISVGELGFKIFDELMYTAFERGIVENSVSEEDIETIFRIMVLVTHIKNEDQLEQYKM